MDIVTTWRRTNEAIRKHLLALEKSWSNAKKELEALPSPTDITFATFATLHNNLRTRGIISARFNGPLFDPILTMQRILLANYDNIVSTETGGTYLQRVLAKSIEDLRTLEIPFVAQESRVEMVLCTVRKRHTDVAMMLDDENLVTCMAVLKHMSVTLAILRRAGMAEEDDVYWYSLDLLWNCRKLEGAVEHKLNFMLGLLARLGVRMPRQSVIDMFFRPVAVTRAGDGRDQGRGADGGESSVTSDGGRKGWEQRRITDYFSPPESTTPGADAERGR